MEARFTSAGRTDKGRVRGHNEDAFLDAPERKLWVVADGMGGHSAGDYASQLIVERLSKINPPAQIADAVDAVEKELNSINDHLQHLAKERNAALIGATVVVLIGGGDFVVCGWAGDSRIYRLRDGKFGQLTRDHSTRQEMLDTGAFEARPGGGAPSANAITRAVGGEKALFLDWVVSGWTPGTQFLLCTDGVTKELDDATLEAALVDAPDAKGAVEKIVDAALQHGGRDNATAVVVVAGAAP